MPPAVAERHAVERAAAAARSGPSASQQRGSRMSRRRSRRRRACAASAVEQARRAAPARRTPPAWPRHASPEPAQQRRAAVEADQRIVRARPGTPAASVAASSAASARGVDAQRVAGVDENAPGREQRGSSPRRALRSGRSVCPVVALGVAPGRAGAGVEQHADHREVDARARALGRRCGRPARASSAARRSTPPASKWRQRLWYGICEVGIARARDVGDHAAPRRRRRVAIDAEVPRVAARRPRRAIARAALADRAAAAQQRRPRATAAASPRRRVIVEPAALGLRQLVGVGHRAVGEVAGGLLGVHLDPRVGGDQLVGDRAPARRPRCRCR